MSITTHRHCGKSLDWIVGVVGEVVEESERSLQRHHQDNEIIKDGEDMIMIMQMEIRFITPFLLLIFFLIQSKIEVNSYARNLA